MNRDVEKIKEKLKENVGSYRKTLKNRNNISNNVCETNFNAANYLFISFKLCKLFPDLKESKIILNFTTPWPRRSYQHESKSVSKDYDKKMGVILRSFSIILLFLIGNMSYAPVVIQDLLFHWCTSALLGYGFLLLIELYNFSPILAILSIFSICLCVHFIVRSHTTMKKLQPDMKVVNIDFLSKQTREKESEKKLSCDNSLVVSSKLNKCLDISAPSSNSYPSVNYSSNSTYSSIKYDSISELEQTGSAKSVEESDGELEDDEDSVLFPNSDNYEDGTRYNMK
jgi:hypothetical protein